MGDEAGQGSGEGGGSEGSLTSSVGSSSHTPTASPSATSASDLGDAAALDSIGVAAEDEDDPYPLARVPPGLFNLGNTCYLNSVVQILYHLPTFRGKVLAFCPSHHALEVDLSFCCKLFLALKEVFELMQLAEERAAEEVIVDDEGEEDLTSDFLAREGVDYIAPAGIINLLRDEEGCAEFDARGQQDAHEFLRFLLDKVNDCMQMEEDNEQIKNVCATHSKSHTHPDLQNGISPLAEPQVPESSVQAPIRVNGDAQTPHTQQKRGIVRKADDITSADNETPTEPSPKRRRASLGKEEEQGADEKEVDAQQKRPLKRKPEQVTSSPDQSASPSEPKRRRKESGQSVEEGPPENPSPTVGNGKKRPYEADGNPPSDEGAAVEWRPKKRKKSVVEELFQGRAVTATRCYECECESQRAEQFLDVSLPVEAGKCLSWALSTQCVEEELMGKNKYFCAKCKTYTEAKRWWQVARVPEVLTVHLKLFTFGGAWSGGVGGKVGVAMACPIRTKLAEWCSRECGERDDEYRLTGVIVHEGTGASSGHYFCYVWDRGFWFCCDDSFVIGVSEEDVKERLFTSMKTKKTAYLLFYSNVKERG